MSLAGKTVVVTRAAEQSGELAALLRQAGATVLEVPTLVVVPAGGRDLEPLDAALRLAGTGAYDGIVLTSANAVAFFHDRLLQLGLSPRALAATPLFAIGPATARALVSRGYAPPVVAAEAIAESLLTTMREHLRDVAGCRLLLPRAREGREVLIDGLRQAGAEVDVVVLYDTLPVLDGPGLPAGEHIDWVTFASPSAVRAFTTRFGKTAAKVACIGPVTARAAAELGLLVSVVAEEHTAAGLVTALVRAAKVPGLP